VTNLSQSDSLKEVNEKMGFNPTGRDGTQMAPRPIWVLGLGVYDYGI
jgi:hypothetical protein